MIQICIATPSDRDGPSSYHVIAVGRTLSAAIARARARLDTYGPLSPSRLFYMRAGVRCPLV